MPSQTPATYRNSPIMAFIVTAVGCAAITLSGCSDIAKSNKSGATDPESGRQAGIEASSKTDGFDFLLKEEVPASPDAAGGMKSSVRFRDVAAKIGVDHIYSNGGSGQLLMVESIGGGGAWLDFDRDGRLDLWLNQGGEPAAADSQSRPSDQIFRQTDVGFQAVTERCFLDEREYSQGTAVGDFDNDGFDDVYVTNVGRNTFWRNLGDGTFEESTVECRVEDRSWSSSSAWSDLDCDGDLDLYVCNYLKYDPYAPFECKKDGEPALCHPRQLDHWPDQVFRNNGDGTFDSAAGEWKLEGPGNKGLGVAIVDMNHDSYPDIYIANDTTANFLFMSLEGRIFEESALRLGCALSGEGQAQASMGIAIGDYDGNQLPDVLLTHFTGETNTLFQNLGELGLHDVSNQTGLRSNTWTRLGFGTVMHDFDADGTQELFIANGHIDERNADGDGYRQHPQLLRFDGDKWNDISGDSGDYFQQLLVGRGASFGDYDADGRPDLMVVHQNDAAVILRNESQMQNWLRIELIGIRSNRRGIGCRVELQQADRMMSTQLIGGSSFAVSHEPAIHVGLGQSSQPVDIRVIWPGGNEQTVMGVEPNRRITIVESVPEG